MNDFTSNFSQSEILNYIDKHPELNLYEAAADLRVPMFKVSEAQHLRLVKWLHKHRNSPDWSLPGYRVDPRPWLSKPKLLSAMKEMNAGAKGVYQRLCAECRISPFYRNQLKECEASLKAAVV